MPPPACRAAAAPDRWARVAGEEVSTRRSTFGGWVAQRRPLTSAAPARASGPPSKPCSRRWGMTAPQEVFQRAIRSVQDRELDSYVELFADDGTLEFPFAPPGAPQRMQGGWRSGVPWGRCGNGPGRAAGASPATTRWWSTTRPILR